MSFQLAHTSMKDSILEEVNSLAHKRETAWLALTKLHNIKSYLYVQLTTCRDIDLSNDYLSAINVIHSIIERQDNILYNTVDVRTRYYKALLSEESTV